MRRSVVRFACLAVLAAALLPRALAQHPGEGHEGHGADLDPAVHVDAEARRVSFEAEIIQNQGLLEAYLCGPNGRTHESLLVATVPSEDLVGALRLIGVWRAQEWVRDEKDLFAMQADKVLVWIEREGRRVLAEDLVQNDYEKLPMRRRGWTVHAKSFEAELPSEMEFSLTFKGLRGAALSTLDSPFAYRPFYSPTLVGRREVLPDLEDEKGEPTHPRVRVVIEPATEEGITRLALEQEGAPPAADAAPFVEAARRIDELKKAYASGIRPLLARRDEPAIAARIDVAVLEVESASYELEILHERRELAAVEARHEPDAWTLEAKRDAVGLFEICRDIAREELAGARAALEAIELASAGRAEDDVRRAELTRDEHRARARALTKRPDLEDAKDQLGRASAEIRPHFERLVEVVSAEIRLAEAEARRAATEREAIGAAAEEVARLAGALAGIDEEIRSSRAVVELYELERRLGKLRRDLRFYESEGIDDKEKAAEIRAQIQEVEAKIAAMKR